MLVPPHMHSVQSSGAQTRQSSHVPFFVQPRLLQDQRGQAPLLGCASIDGACLEPYLGAC